MLNATTQLGFPEFRYYRGLTYPELFQVRPKEMAGARVQTLTNDLKEELVILLPRLLRFGRALTRSAAEAEDLVQEACLKALDREETWDRSLPLDRWVFSIVRNTWVSELRKRQVRLGHGQVPAEDSNELKTHRTGENYLAVSELISHINELPSELRAVLLLISVEGYSYAEASTLLEIPVGTVMSRVHRARKALSSILCESHGGHQ